MKDYSGKVVGWREVVGLPALGLSDIPAKIDTGARTSSLHAEVLEEIMREDGKYVRFAVDWDGVTHECEAIHVDVRGITSSNGEAQKRFVIKTTLQIGEMQFRAEISLADRSVMKFPLLVGRSALRRRFLVDSSRSWLQSPGAIDSKDRES
ncbi:ATP-dependent zinc protease family protein [Aurantiacibacter poecillastricola]|uniref:ATP-dependent zinc protease family protein n=1 Tax=Aurantiacibacter poecillastricola TaxID=3064385 RepID=UPI00273E2441|nr:RimK/LysX family protein [Aurantiacibacter sp. 219JJ12-13]MDP5261976.1 RimK/LysX family protein [Aurantiacibacter sp. 219JJ12-13]